MRFHFEGILSFIKNGLEFMAADVKNNEYAKLTTAERVGYGLGDFAQNLVFGTVGGFLAVYMLQINALPAFMGTTLFLLVRALNAVTDPLIGTFVDKHMFKGGDKYRPWLMIAGVPLMIMAALQFFPASWAYQNAWWAGISYALTAVIYSFVNIPYGSLNASMTRDPDEIDKLTSTRMMLANIANLLVYTLFPMLLQMAAPAAREMKDTGLFGLKLEMGDYLARSAGPAWFRTWAIYGAIGAVALVITYFVTKERIKTTKEASEDVKVADLWLSFKANKPLQILALFFFLSFLLMFFQNTVFSLFVQFNTGHSEWMGAIGLIASIPGIFFPALWPKFRNVFGKKGFFYFFFGMFIVGTLLLWVWTWKGMHDNLALAYVARFIHQFGITSATGFMWALVPEVVNHGELVTGKREAGQINAIMGLAFKFGITIASFAMTVIGVFGYKSGATVQTAAAQQGINVAMVWIPIVLALVAKFVMARYPLTEMAVKENN